jgi:hypothetical protein
LVTVSETLESLPCHIIVFDGMWGSQTCAIAVVARVIFVNIYIGIWNHV